MTPSKCKTNGCENVINNKHGRPNKSGYCRSCALNLRIKIKKYEWTVKDNISNKKCLVCQKEFKKGDKFIMVPIQEPSGDFFINSIAIQIHTKCYYVDKEQ